MMNKTTLNTLWMIAVTLLFTISCASNEDQTDDTQDSSYSGAKTTCGVVGNEITVSGSAIYEDKRYNRWGMNGVTDAKAIRYAAVDIVNASDNAVLGSGFTDAQGDYEISYVAGAAVNVYVRLMSDSSRAQKQNIKVHNLDGSILSVINESLSATSECAYNADFLVLETHAVGGAFNILDVYLVAGDFIHSLDGNIAPAMKVYWEQGSQNGSWFCDTYEYTWCEQGGGVYVLGGNSLGGGDKDEYDDDVLLHEYGHFIASKLSKDDSPGDDHYLSDLDQDMRLSWSEGWGNFFHAAVKYWQNQQTDQPEVSVVSSSTPLSLYVDTSSTSTVIVMDIDVSKTNPTYRYATNEISVASVLWNVMKDSDPDGAMSGIWDVITSSTFLVSPAVNIETFWDGWLSTVNPDETEKARLWTYFNDRSIDYSIDDFEADTVADGTREIALDATETHTLYAGDGAGVVDTDFIAFTAVQDTAYSIRTSNLKNGADTYLELFDTDQTTSLEVNDNNTRDIPYSSICEQDCPPNNLSTLSSVIHFTASTSGKYYIKVSPSSLRPPSAGKYGSYNLEVSENIYSQ